MLKNKATGFTIVEILIATAIMGMFLASIMYLYQRNTSSFKITVWKQDRTRESQVFWAFLKKNIEEATHKLWFPPSSLNANPKIASAPAPLLFRSGIIKNVNSKILSWNVSMLNFDFTSGKFAHSDKNTNFYVELKDKKLSLKEAQGKKIAEIKDVESVEVKVESIVRSTQNNEYESETQLVAGANPSAQGTLVHIAILLKPPDNYIGNVIIPQNHKFKLNVGSEQKTGPF